jgi:hypothetical protein
MESWSLPMYRIVFSRKTHCGNFIVLLKREIYILIIPKPPSSFKPNLTIILSNKIRFICYKYYPIKNFFQISIQRFGFLFIINYIFLVKFMFKVGLKKWEGLIRRTRGSIVHIHTHPSLTCILFFSNNLLAWQMVVN